MTPVVLQQLMRKLRLAIGTGIVKLVDDTRKIQQLQVTALDDEVRSEVNHMQNYGFTSVPLEGAEVLLAAVGGNRNHLVAVLVDDGRHRKKSLAAGEVAMYTDEGDCIVLKRGRIIEVTAGTKVKVIAPDVEIVASSKVTITSPTVTMSGDLTVSGTVQGNVVKTAAGRNLDTLRVTGVTVGGGVSGTPV